jgi:alcohol dehydrogenase
MKAAIYNRFNGVIEIKEVDDPVISGEDANIEVKASGICRSDWRTAGGGTILT